MRLLNKSSVLLDLPDLGFSPRDYALMDGLIRRPDGIILVTGPTGSGKTTTLYACINRINQPNLNILTAEDPGRVRDRRHPPGARAAEDRAHVRERAPRLPPPGPRRRHGRRDPRQGDGRHRDQRVAHRPPRALDHPHERRGRRRHAHGRHGSRAVPPPIVSVIGILAQRLVRVLCPHCKVPVSEPRTPSSRSSGSRPERVRARAARSARPTTRYFPAQSSSRSLDVLDPLPSASDVLQGEGLRPVQQHRLQRPARHLRAAPDRRRRRPARPPNADAQAIKRAAMEQGMDSLRDDGARKVLTGSPRSRRSSPPRRRTSTAEPVVGAGRAGVGGG